MYRIAYGNKKVEGCGVLDVDENVNHSNKIDACENIYIYNPIDGQHFEVEVNWYSKGRVNVREVPFVLAVTVHGKIVFYSDQLKCTRVSANETFYAFKYAAPEQMVSRPTEFDQAYSRIRDVVLEKICAGLDSVFVAVKLQVSEEASLLNYELFSIMGVGGSSIRKLRVGDQIVVLRKTDSSSVDDATMQVEPAEDVDPSVDPTEGVDPTKDVLGLLHSEEAPISLTIALRSSENRDHDEDAIKPLIRTLFGLSKWLLVAGDTAAVRRAVDLLQSLEKQFPPPTPEKDGVKLKTRLELGMKGPDRTEILKNRIAARSKGLINEVLALLNADNLDKLNEQQLAGFLGQVASNSAGRRLAKRVGDIDVTAELVAALEKMAGAAKEITDEEEEVCLVCSTVLLLGIGGGYERTKTSTSSKK